MNRLLPFSALPLLLVAFAGPVQACRIDTPGTRCVTSDGVTVITGYMGTQEESTTADRRIAAGDTPTSQAIRTIAGGARLVTVAPRAAPAPVQRTRASGPLFDPGSTLPDDYMILLNTERYGLPAPRDGWAYFRAGGEVYRVNIQSREVLERVTDQTNAAF